MAFTAFQANAFQNNAFQIFGGSGSGSQNLGLVPYWVEPAKPFRRPRRRRLAPPLQVVEELRPLPIPPLVATSVAAPPTIGALPTSSAEPAMRAAREAQEILELIPLLHLLEDDL